MDTLQQIQEDQYVFPYHHLVRAKNGTFSQSRHVAWGYIYISYLSIVLDTIEKIPHTSLLDVGCGDGKLLFELQKKQSDTTLAGVDYSVRAIALAKAFSPHVQFYSGDITDPTTLTRSYDIITLIETLEHIPQTEIPNFLKAIHAHLKNEGRLIITVPSDNEPTDKKHYQHFNKNSLSDTLAPYFEIETCEYLNKKGWGDKIIYTLLSNRFFILTQYSTVNFLYSLYVKHFLHATPHDGKRILAVCKKKQ